MQLVKNYCRDQFHLASEGWNRFWFSSADPATLGLMRILAGAMLLYTHLVWTLRLEQFFGPNGWLSDEFVTSFQNSPFAWSHLHGMDSIAVLWLVHVAALLIVLLFMIGLFSRLTSVLAFLITVAYAHRVPGALFGLDQINGMLALYLMVGPSGDAYSLDAIIRRRRSQPGATTGGPSVMANIAVRLIQIHLCIIYLFAGCGKLLGGSWWEGTALWGALASYEYQSLDMTWLAAWPLLINLLTHISLAWEVSFAALVWPRFSRPIVLLLAIPLHLGIAAVMGMITFGLVMLIANLAFVSPRLVRAVVEPLAARGRGGEGAGN